MSDFGAMSLLELFREELDAHAAALDAGPWRSKRHPTTAPRWTP